MTTAEHEKIARAFVRARRAATPLAAFPGDLPAARAGAYAVQEAAIALWPDRIAGWKVAGVAPHLRDEFGAPRLAGPAFAGAIHVVNGDRPARFAIFTGGFAAIEAEFIFRMGADLPAGDANDPDRLAAAIAAMHAGAEIASSPLATINELGPRSVTSDFGNNAGLILGPELADWRWRDLESLTTRTIINGATVGEGSAARVAGGPLAAAAFLASALAERGRMLHAGDLISTGMTTGIHNLNAGDAVRIEFSEGVVIAGIAERAAPAA